MSLSLMLGFNLDFSSCDNLIGFCNSSYIQYFKVTAGVGKAEEKHQ